MKYYMRLLFAALVIVFWLGHLEAATSLVNQQNKTLTQNISLPEEIAAEDGNGEQEHSDAEE